MRVRLLAVMLVVLAGCGDDSARVMFNESVAALRGGDLVRAEIAAEKAAARDRELAGLGDFALGCAAFIRCEREEIKFFGPLGAAAAISAAIVHAEAARDFWQNAAASREDWPEARRNVERALFKLADLGKKAEDAKARSKPQPIPKPAPKDDKGIPQSQGEDPKPAPRVDPITTELSPDQITRVLDRLAEKEKEKVRLRRAERQAHRAQVEKDW
jgi:hypothetical protein